MKYRTLYICAALIGFGLVVSCTSIVEEMTEVEKRAADPRNKTHMVGDKASGYVYMTSQTRDMQDDDIANPAFTWIDLAEEKWSKVEGKAGKSCASCHQDVNKAMKGVANKYPQYDPESKKLIALQVKINRERTKRMGAKPWKWESDQMLGMAALVKLQSRGMPVNVKIDGPAKPFFEKGKEFYNQRRGLLDMACANCHVDNAGNMARSNVLSQGMINGFPVYRLKWQKPGSVHRRFIGCNKDCF